MGALVYTRSRSARQSQGTSPVQYGDTVVSIATSDENADESQIPEIALPEIFVSPVGNDEAVGDEDHPMRTLTNALWRVSEFRASGKLSLEDPVQIWLREGAYVIDDCITISTSLSNVNISAWIAEKVVCTAQHPITGFSIEEVNGVRVFVKQLDVEAGEASFKSLFGQRGALKLSRYPKTGYLDIAGTNPADALWDESTTPSSITLGQRSFNASPEDISGIQLCDGMQARIVHKWHDELSDITALDTETGKISLARPASLTIEDSNRYCLENVFATLSDPGEWYLDHATGKLYYVPNDGEKPDELVLYAAYNSALIALDGASNVSFHRIRFARTDWEYGTPDSVYSFGWCVQNGIETPQGAVDAPGAITIRNSSGISFTNCDFMDLESTAIRMEEGVSNTTVESCLFQNVGASAVFVGGRNVDKSDPHTSSSITISNNKIVLYGRRNYAAPGIHVLFCDQAQISNNEISFGRYTGISCGWVWGYANHVTNNIQITNNLIHNIGDGSLCDMGGIYTLGDQPGTTLSGNVIHNVRVDKQYGYGGWGIYLDEGSSEITVDSNLVFACSSQCLYTHYGSANEFRNNICALSLGGQINFGLQSDKMGNASTYADNLILTTNGIPAYNNYSSEGVSMEGTNLTWDMQGQDCLHFSVINSTGTHLLSYDEASSQGLTNGTNAEDPQFRNPRRFDFQLKDSSPAIAAGFVPWDYNNAGTLTDTAIGLYQRGGTAAYNDSSAHVISSIV